MTDKDDQRNRPSEPRDYGLTGAPELRLAELQRLAGIGEWEYDPASDTLRWSDGTCRLFALDPARAPRSLDEFLQWVHPDDREAVRAGIAAGRTDRPDYRVPLPDGSVRHLHETVRQEWDTERRMVRWRGVVQDVSDRKRMEEVLRRSTRMLELVNQAQAQFIDEGVFDDAFTKLLRALLELTDSEYGTIGEVRRNTDGSPAFVHLALSGRGADAADWNHGDRPPETGWVPRNLAAVCQAAAEAGRIILSNDPRRLLSALEQSPGSPPLQCSLGLPMYYQGELIGVLAVANRAEGYAEDYGAFLEPLLTTCAGLIHARRAREEARRLKRLLVESEATYRSLFEGAQDAIFVADAESGMLVDANHRALDLIGRNLEEIRTMHHSALLAPGAIALAEHLFAEAVHQDAPGLRRVVLAGAGGRSVPVEISSGGIIEVRGRRLHLGIFRDIGPRIQAEEALRRREEELRKAQHLGRVGNWSWNARTDGIEWSEEYCRIYGLDPALPPPGYDEHLRIYTPESAARLDAAVKRNLDTGEPYALDLEFYAADGTTRWVTARSETVRDPGGRIVGLRGTAQDITERKRAEELLKRSEARMRRAETIGKLGCWEWSIATNELVWSDEVYRLYGLDPLRGRPAFDVVERTLAPECHDRFMAALADALQHGSPFEGEYRMIGLDGRERFTYTSGEVHRDAQGRPVSMFGVVQDITERKRAEEDLRASETRYRTILQTTLSGFWIVDPDGSLAEVNEAYCRMSGFSRQELLRMRISDLEACERPDETANHLQKIMGGQSDRFESRHRRKDGTVYDVEVSAQRLPIAGEWIVAFIRDITERKQAEEILRFNGEILENMEEGVHLVRMDDGNILYANRRFETMFGYAPGELIGKPVSLLNAPEPRAPQTVMAEIIGTVRRTGCWSGRLQNVRKDGSRFWSQATVSFHRHARHGETCITVQTDVTETMRAEEAIRRERDRADLYLDTAAVMMVALDLEGRVILINQKGLEVLGCAREEVIGKDWHLTFIPPALRAVMKERCREIMEGRTALPAYFENPILAAGGTERLMAWSNTYLRDPEGKVSGTLSSCLDITERRRAEEAIQRSLAEKEILLKEIHHRVKNNLQVVASLLDLQSGTLSDPAALRVFQESRNRVRVMAMVHEKLYKSHDLSRIPLPEFLTGLAEYLSGIYGLPDRPVGLQCAIEEAGVGVDEAIACGLIVNELVSNAFKYAFLDRPVGAEPAELRLDVRILQEGDLEIAVADNGRGLPPSVDVQATPTMGLQLVSLLVRQLKGSLTVERERGSRFRIRFKPAGAEGEEHP